MREDRAAGSAQGATIEREILKGCIDMIILSMLRDEDLYGYELAKRVRERTGERFELKEGTLYIAFKRMEQSGFVESYWGDGASAGGRRKYYRLLPRGRSHIGQCKGEWRRLKEIMDVFLEGVSEDEQG